MAIASFHGLRVLALESRRATEVATLISTYGGQPLVAPALREVPLTSNTDALECAAALLRGEVDIVIFLTGVGTRALVRVIEGTYPRDTIIAALARTKVVARGPKPLAVLRELQVPVWVAAPEPNTWREVLAALDAKAEEQPLAGAHIAVQEYGVSNTELLEALRARDAVVTRVPVYLWALPEGCGAAEELGDGDLPQRDRRRHVHDQRAGGTPVSDRQGDASGGQHARGAGPLGGRIYRSNDLGGVAAPRARAGSRGVAWKKSGFW